MPTNFSDRQSFNDQEAIDFHAGAQPGKLEIRASKPMATQKDLSLAYSLFSSTSETEPGFRLNIRL